MNDQICTLILEYAYSSVFCILGDCSKHNCHHCYPVKSCSLNHLFCQKHGTCLEFIDVFLSNFLHSYKN